MAINDKMYNEWLELKDDGRANFVMSKALKFGAVIFVALLAGELASSGSMRGLLLKLFIAAFAGIATGFGQWHQCEKRWREERARNKELPISDITTGASGGKAAKSE